MFADGVHWTSSPLYYIPLTSSSISCFLNQWCSSLFLWSYLTGKIYLSGTVFQLSLDHLWQRKEEEGEKKENFKSVFVIIYSNHFAVLIHTCYSPPRGGGIQHLSVFLLVSQQIQERQSFLLDMVRVPSLFFSIFFFFGINHTLNASFMISSFFLWSGEGVLGLIFLFFRYSF
jgi:hypothetical protein